MDNISDKRKYERFRNLYITRFRVKPYDGKDSNYWEKVALVDVSASGLFFYSKIDLEVGTILDFKIGFSHVYSSMVCVGRVIRAKKALDAPIIGYGIEFIEISELTKIVLNKSLKIDGPPFFVPSLNLESLFK
jgi:hypothetical protein